MFLDVQLHGLKRINSLFLKSLEETPQFRHSGNLNGLGINADGIPDDMEYLGSPLEFAADETASTSNKRPKELAQQFAKSIFDNSNDVQDVKAAIYANKDMDVIFCFLLKLGLDSMVCDEMYRQLSEMVEHFGDRLVIPTWTKSKLGQRLQAYDQSERTRLSFELFVVSLVSRFPAILDSEATLRASLKSNIL